MVPSTEPCTMKRIQCFDYLPERMACRAAGSEGIVRLRILARNVYHWIGDVTRLHEPTDCIHVFGDRQRIHLGLSIHLCLIAYSKVVNGEREGEGEERGAGG